MKEYIESFKTALYQIATTFLFFVPYTCRLVNHLSQII